MKVTIERAFNGFILRTKGIGENGNEIEEITLFEQKPNKAADGETDHHLSEAEAFLDLVNCLAGDMGVNWSDHNKYDFYSCIDVDQKVKNFYWEKVEKELEKVGKCDSP